MTHSVMNSAFIGFLVIFVFYFKQCLCANGFVLLNDSDIYLSAHPNDKFTYVNVSIERNSNSVEKSTEHSPPKEEHSNASAEEKSVISCHDANINCALRSGCGRALQSYMFDCSDLLKGLVDKCDEFCKASLIALVSSEQGQDLINCRCDDNRCLETKERLDDCKMDVIKATGGNATVSCNVAHLICSADASCSKALSYYDKFCGKMFDGRECTYRCNNSISILSRQKKASKLATCVCEGTESFPCEKIKTNMANLCFHQGEDQEEEEREEETNEIGGSRNQKDNSTESSGNSVNSLRMLRLVPLNDFRFDSVLGASSFWFHILGGLTLSSVVRWVFLESI